MADESPLRNPLLIAVWPGMGHVAISAGYYLMAKLGMHLVAELAAHQHFEMEHVVVKDGLIQLGRLPRSRVFLWRDPTERHDLLVFIGEAQPPSGKAAFCRILVEFAKQMGVERLYTFAAMATNMHPTHPARVFGAATNQECLAQLQKQEVELLEEGHIGGLNGVLLGVAAESGVNGACLLGEMPHIFSQLPFPKASLAVLKVFAQMAGITVDFTELEEQSQAVESQLGDILSQIENAVRAQRHEAELVEEEEYRAEPEEPLLNPEDQQRIEQLFAEAGRDRAKAYELKRELDRLNLFHEYEDRFLDLFKANGPD